MEKDEATLIQNLEHIPFYGRWKDLYIFFGTRIEDEMLDEFVAQLWKDKQSLSLSSISLAAKYAPSEGSSIDRKYNAVEKLCAFLEVTKKSYRQQFLAPLRKHLNIVERQLTANPEDWASINFEHVPSVAMKKYAKAFSRRQPARYAEYLQKVKAGQSKMNVSQLHPHEIIEQYFKVADWKSPLDDINEVAEVQWTEYIKNIQARTHVGAALAMIDVSGSMHGKPVQVAVALGLLLSELNEGTFKNKVLTFSEQPSLVTVQGVTLRDRIRCVTNMSWGMNTNILAAFGAILDAAKIDSVSAENMPSTIYILSDMQFDEATRSSSDEVCRVWGQSTPTPTPTPPTATTWEIMKEMYAACGYNLPKVVYWNLRGNTTDFVVKANENNVCCISGFSPSILELIVDGEEVSPVLLMRRSIDRPRYDRLKIVVPELKIEVVADYKGNTEVTEPKVEVAPKTSTSSTCLVS